MSPVGREKKIMWPTRSQFILDRFAEASKNAQLRGKFMFSGGWVQYIHNNYDIPEGFSFTKQDLSKALRSKYDATLDNVEFANDHGVCRDRKTEIDPMTNEGSKTVQWYFAAVAPGSLRPLPRGGGPWYDDVWTKPPEKTSSRNLDATAADADGDVVAQRAKTAAKKARVDERPHTRSTPSTNASAVASSSKRKAASDAYHDAQQRSEEGQYSHHAGKKKARNLPDLNEIVKEVSNFDDLLFSTDAEGVVSKTKTYESVDGKTIVVFIQQLQDTSCTHPKDSDVDWTSANELKTSLVGRSGLTKEEKNILRVLAHGHAEVEGTSKYSPKSN